MLLVLLGRTHLNLGDIALELAKANSLLKPK